MDRSLLHKATIRYISPESLAAHIDDDRLVIIDVRDSDYKYAHVRHSVNYPSRHFNRAAIEDLLEKYPIGDGKIYVFHCMRSRHRGPLCAKRFIDYLLVKGVEDFPKVYILKGGLKTWNELYGDDPSLMVPIPSDERTTV